MDSEREATTLYRRVSNTEFRPCHVVEVGVHRPESCSVYDYIAQGVRCTLVEPDPEGVAAIRARFASYPNVTLHPVGVYHSRGRVDLARRGASSFIAEMKVTPAIVNDRYRLDHRDTVVVDVRTFDELDDGTIDLLAIDAEGCEWYVLKHMVSRPTVLSIETHGSRYRNPFLREISQWIEANGYVLWYRSTSDSVFVKQGTIPVTRRDRLEHAIMGAYLGYRRSAKRVKHAFLRALDE